MTAMKEWLDGLGYRNCELTSASEDASFRRYFRLHQGADSWIIMDAPPEKEPCDAFVKIALKLRGVQLSAPEILHENHDEGFLVLTDFGRESYLQALNSGSMNRLYADATAAILSMQTQIDADDLPPYDEMLLRREMNLFKEWFLEQLLNIELNPNQLNLWQLITDDLVHNALEQPQAFVHRDYHSRNLMNIEAHPELGSNPGILDFQDAVKGPVTYDLVSLFRDCYIDWPQHQVDRWVLDFLDVAGQKHLEGIKPDQFMHWFNLMGVQRHLKAIGIFSRLSIRDEKDQFLLDIPRTFNYLKNVVAQEMSLADLNTLIDELNLDSKINLLFK